MHIVVLIFCLIHREKSSCDCSSCSSSSSSSDTSPDTSSCDTSDSSKSKHWDWSSSSSSSSSSSDSSSDDCSCDSDSDSSSDSSSSSPSSSKSKKLNVDSLIWDPKFIKAWRKEFHCKPPIWCDPDAKYRTIDGTCNNLHVPSWGSAGTLFKRYLPAHYENGNYILLRLYQFVIAFYNILMINYVVLHGCCNDKLCGSSWLL